MGDADTGLVAASVCPHVRSESSQYVVTIRSVADEFELIATPREEVGNSRPVTAILADTVVPACTIVELLHQRDSPDYRAFRITARGVGTRPETVIFL